MSLKEKLNRIEYESLLRPNGSEIPSNPEISRKVFEVPEKVEKRGGAEVNVFDVILQYKDLPRTGFVYKQFKKDLRSISRTNEDFETQLKDILGQWNRIREVRQELKKENKQGFNMPGTVRGVRGKGEYGILTSDLSEGGSKIVIDLKSLRSHPEVISQSQWEEIKQAVLNDLDIAASHDVKLVSGLSGLDAWLVTIDKKSGECKVYLSDIGMYSSKTRDPLARILVDPSHHEALALQKKGIEKLHELEVAIAQGWEEQKMDGELPKESAGAVKREKRRFRFFWGS